MVSQQDAFLKDVCILLARVWRNGCLVTGGELYRTREQQGIYYAWGKTKTMNSCHLNRMAVDLQFFRPNGEQITEREDLQIFGDYWESLNSLNRWGGNWSTFYDGGHFERREE